MSRNEKTTSVIDYMERQKKLRLITFVVCAVVVASVLLATMVMGLYSQYSKPTSVADFEITTTNGEVEIREYTGDALFVNIPPQINGCPVTAIGDEAFYGNERVRRITMPDSVTEIGSSAFGLCTSLRSVELSENITAIGDYAFTRCLALSEVSLPEGITQIGEYTFTHSGIRRIDLPQKVTAVGKGAFMNCHELQDVTLPDSITELGESVFFGCDSLAKLTIPEGVTALDPMTFYDCYALTVTAPHEPEYYTDKPDELTAHIIGWKQRNP